MHHIFKHFCKWNDLLLEAGIEVELVNPLIDINLLIADWGVRCLCTC